MANLNALSTITTAATTLSNLILVSPQATLGYQPQNTPTNNGVIKQNPPALLFHYEGEQTAALESDITDHFIEDNTALQDQISLKPVKITTHGFIGELNDVAPFGLQTAQAIADKLTAIGAYVPALSTTALIAYDEAFLAYQIAANAVNAAVSTWSSVTGAGGESVINGTTVTVQPNQNKQQVIFQQFFGYWSTRTQFTIQTPWAVFQNMAIMSLRAIQDAETNTISDFEITFKQLQFASTQTLSAANAAIISQLLQTRLNSQAASGVDQGISTPNPSIPLSSGLSTNYPGSFA